MEDEGGEGGKPQIRGQRLRKVGRATAMHLKLLSKIRLLSVWTRRVEIVETLID